MIGSTVELSALWAAYGDALGFITETRGLAGARSTLPSGELTAPIAWQRRVGGRFGPTVSLPAGCYSDDTQLRLATSRSIRGDGSFDVEAFAKIELPVFLTYYLGAGLGTTAAAHNLSRRDVTWYSNFFETKDVSYLKGGGNGAAMRIQPHVWGSRTLDSKQMLVDVLRNAITTHGHPRGFLGALFHAQCLAYAAHERSVPGPDVWLKVTDSFGQLRTLWAADENLERVWLPTWESRSRSSLADAIRTVEEEQRTDIRSLGPLLDSAEPKSVYAEALKRLGLLRRESAGSGTKTALMAAVLCYIFRNAGVEAALIAASNQLGSDTDTIGTMAGAIFGSIAPHAPKLSPMDWGYINGESERLRAISEGLRPGSFKYPDLLHWRAPKNQADGVGLVSGKVAVAGLGFATPSGELVRAPRQDGIAWEWMHLELGQSILIKRRLKLAQLPQYALPPADGETAGLKIKDEESRTKPFAERPMMERSAREHVQAQPNLFEPRGGLSSAEIGRAGLDRLTDEAIRSGFDPLVVGKNLMILIDGSENPIEASLAYVAILAKARLARRRVQPKSAMSGSPNIPTPSKGGDS